MTGIGNRLAFERRLESELGRARRLGGPLSIVLLDVDLFKAFNDRYGHIAGDLCLVEVARAITGAVKRPGNFVSRFGGEEFAVTLPDTDRSGASMVAEAIRAAVAKLDIPLDVGASSRVTVSLGVAEIRIAREADLAVARDDVIGRADAALYEAKAAGRDRVEVAT